MYLVITGLHTFGCHGMFKAWTSIDGPDGLSLLAARFHSDDDQANFEALAGVQPITGTITADQAAALSAMGLPVNTTNTAADVRAMAKAHCPGMV